MIDYGQMTFEQALNDPRFSHCSDREYSWGTKVLVYFNEPTSPSGVLLAAGAWLKDVQELLTAKGIRVNSGPSRGDIAAGQWGIGGVRV